MKIQILVNKSTSLFLLFSITLLGRSVHRPYRPYLPQIATRWIDDTKTYTIRSPYLEAHPFFNLFDKHYFDTHLLPQGPITFRHNDDQHVTGETLSALIEELLQEIKQKKRRYSHFKILCQSNFDRKNDVGLIIVKCKDYPFVVKVFLETPENIINPYHTGPELKFSLYMAGGINRHLCGFTRVSNAEKAKKEMAGTQWEDKIIIPRKWHWKPEKCRWIEITGSNLGKEKNHAITLPGTYCVIADAIEFERKLTVFTKVDRKSSLRFCNDLNFRLDPNLNNFLIEKETGKIALIDTEHFPSIVGLKEIKHPYTSQVRWYMHLSAEIAQKSYLTTKKELKEKQFKISPLLKL